MGNMISLHSLNRIILYICFILNSKGLNQMKLLIILIIAAYLLPMSIVAQVSIEVGWIGVNNNFFQYSNEEIETTCSYILSDDKSEIYFLLDEKYMLSAI